MLDGAARGAAFLFFQVRWKASGGLATPRIVAELDRVLSIPAQKSGSLSMRANGYKPSFESN